MSSPDGTGAPIQDSSTKSTQFPLMPTSGPRALVRYLHSEVKMSDRELKKITGTHRVTIRRWRSKQDQGEPRAIGRLDDLRVIVGLLVNSGALSAEEAGRFLRSRDANLDYRAPLALLAQTEDEDQREQEFERVLQAALTLVDGLRAGPATPRLHDRRGAHGDPPVRPEGRTAESNELPAYPTL